MPLELPSPYRAFSDRSALSAVQHGLNVLVAAGFTPDLTQGQGPIGGAIPGKCYAWSGHPAGLVAVEYLAEQMLSKLAPTEGSQELEEAALLKFDLAEQICANTNRRFATYLLGHRPEDRDVSAVLVSAREKIGRLYAGLSMVDIAAGCTFTSGASNISARAVSTPVHKYSLMKGATIDASTLSRRVFQHDPSFGGGICQELHLISESNRVLCVRKKYDADRTIGAEASLNVLLQKGAHAAMRRCLKMVGCNLDDQRTNQDLARLGAATGLVCTVDKKMASDTSAFNAVEWFFTLVPKCLWDVLEGTRHPSGTFASHHGGSNRSWEYEKFSSMGNAITFEVETSIFWAVAVAACEKVGADSRFVSVYGDDVVIPTRAVDLYIRAITEAGYVINTDKTHTEVDAQDAGLFRESCGKHYSGHHEVTPFYVKKEPETILEVFHLVNNLYRWITRVGKLLPERNLAALWSYWEHLRTLVEPKWRQPRIPDGKGDGAFVGPFDACTPPTRRRKSQVEGYTVEVLTASIDTACGISETGDPMIWVRDRKKGNQLRPLSRPRKEDRKSVEGISLRGFLLASLERLERRGPPWYVKTRRIESMRYIAHVPLTASETFGIALPERGVRVGSVLLHLGREAWAETDENYALVQVFGS